MGYLVLEVSLFFGRERTVMALMRLSSSCLKRAYFVKEYTAMSILQYFLLLLKIGG